MSESNADKYLTRAAECLLLAMQSGDAANRVLLLEMAQTYAKLAVLERSRSESG